MDDEVDYDELLADAEQDETFYGDYQDDIEAELAMEAEESMGIPNSSTCGVRRSSDPKGISVTPAPVARIMNGGSDHIEQLKPSATGVRRLSHANGGGSERVGGREVDEADFDQMCTEAERSGGSQYDLDDDLEAELAMRYELSSTRSPKRGGIGIGVTPPAPTPRAGSGTVGTTLSTDGHPTPLTLEKRLGLLRPGDDGDCENQRQEPSDEAAVRRALNSEGLSPLNPVLQEEVGNDRWKATRATVLASRVAGNRLAGGKRGDERLASTSLAGAAASSHVGGAPLARKATKVNIRGIVLSRPALDCDTIPFMQFGGQMLHLRVRPGRHSGASALDNQHHGGDGGMDVAQKSGNLLRTPMAELMDRVNERRVIERSLAMEAMETCDAEEGSTSVGPERDRGGDFHGSKRGNGRDSVAGLGKGVGGFGRTVLWVDKYAPNGFRDLLSDERINREVLRAVKTWDHFVFKKPSASSAKVAKTEGRGGKGRGPSGKGAYASALDHGSGSGSGEDTRPEVKVIMLCGPPGLGKTTLAQVVARHAGYRVYEINASDDRSAPVLQQRMTEAMEGNTLLADKRPNMIVLDEVDGADGKSAAQVIVDMVTAPLRGGSGSGGKKGAKGSKKKPLTRPLMLICNDQWTPALRPIRALAQVFVFRSKASPTRLVQCLRGGQTVCAAEGLCVNTDALTQLADRSHLDVRSCLNTLQFLAKKVASASSGGVRNVSAALLTMIGEGMKDERTDLFQVLRSVFVVRKGAKRRLFVGGNENASGMYVPDRTGEADVFEEVQTFNDHGKVLGGLHENFLGIRFNDPTLCKVAAAVDWLHYADLMDARINRLQDYSFQRYAPLAAVGMHLLCRSDQRVGIAPPKKDFEFRAAHAAKSNILQSFSDGRQLGCSGRTPQAVVMDMLSHLMDILAPTLRPLNPDLQSPHERARFRTLVGVLVSCGLTFAPQSYGPGAGVGSGEDGRSLSGGYGPLVGAAVQDFALEPAIDQLLKYEGYPFAHPTLVGPLRPIVAHEVNLECMRRNEAARKAMESQEAENGANGVGSSTRDISASPSRNGDLTRSSAPAAAAAAAAEMSEAAPAIAPVISPGQHKLPFTSSTKRLREETGGAHGDGHGDPPSAIPSNSNSNSNSKPGNGNGGAQEASTDPEAAREDRPKPALVTPFWKRTSRVHESKDDPRPTAGSNGDSKRRASGDGKVANDGSGAHPKRPVVNSGSGGGGGPGSSAKERKPLRFQFRAGYTNAVRRPVRMKDLL